MVDLPQGLAAQKYANMAKSLEGIKSALGNEDKSLVGQGPNFGELLEAGIRNAVDAQRKSESISAKAIVGEAELTDVVTSITKAEVALDTVLAVRDRMLTAYQEIMRTQI